MVRDPFRILIYHYYGVIMKINNTWRKYDLRRVL